jgi:hypothetical protein
VITAVPTPKGAVKITAEPVKSFFSNGALTGTATLTPGPGGTATITNGTVKESHGTGGQAGHSLTATFHRTGSTTTSAYKITYTGVYK